MLIDAFWGLKEDGLLVELEDLSEGHACLELPAPIVWFNVGKEKLPFKLGVHQGFQLAQLNVFIVVVAYSTRNTAATQACDSTSHELYTFSCESY